MAIPYIPYCGPVVTRDRAIATGSKTYFTGNACIHGHVSERQVTGKRCITCRRDRYDADYFADNYRRNREKKIAQAAEYFRKNPTKNKDWYAANREHAIRQSAQWKLDNPERVKETLEASKPMRAKKASERYESNKEEMLRYGAEWKRKNPGRVRKHKLDRRARERNAEGSHTEFDIMAIFDMQKGRCANPICRKALKGGYDIDHIIALSKGGTNYPSNLQLLCPRCNRRKGAKHPLEFSRENGLLI